jgi:hypothetical protein
MRREQLLKFADSRVIHIDGELAYFGSGVAGASTEGLAEFSVKEKPEHLPDAEASRQADKQWSVRGQKCREVLRCLLEVCDAVQTGEIRKCTVKQGSGLEFEYSLGGKNVERYWGIGGFLMQTIRGDLNHLFGCVTGSNRDGVLCKEERVFACATVEL